MIRPVCTFFRLVCTFPFPSRPFTQSPNHIFKIILTFQPFPYNSAGGRPRARGPFCGEKLLFRPDSLFRVQIFLIFSTFPYVFSPEAPARAASGRVAEVKAELTFHEISNSNQIIRFDDQEYQTQTQTFPACSRLCQSRFLSLKNLSVFFEFFQALQDHE